MYENDYGKTPPLRFGENAVTLPLDVDRPCFILNHKSLFDRYIFHCDLIWFKRRIFHFRIDMIIGLIRRRKKDKR